MNINLYKDSNGIWHADCTDLPGSPPVGAGNNPYEAIGSLVAVLMHPVSKRDFGNSLVVASLSASKHPRGNDKVVFQGGEILGYWAEAQVAH